MPQNYEVFKTDIDVAIKNAKDTLKQLKEVEAGLKSMGGYSTDLSKNFKNLQTTLKQFSTRNVSLFGKDFSSYINKSTSEFEKLDATIDSLFKKLPKKAEPAVILLRKRFGELRAEVASTDAILSSLQKYDIALGKMEKSKVGQTGPELAGTEAAITAVQAAKQKILDQLKKEGRSVESVEALYKQQLMSLQQVGVQVKSIGEGQAQIANAQRATTQSVKEAIIEQAKLVKLKEQEALQQGRIAIEEKRFEQIEARRAALRSQGALGIARGAGAAFGAVKDIVQQGPVTGIGDMMSRVKAISQATGDLRKNFGDITTAVNLFGAQGGNAFVALRRAIYGTDTPVGKLGELLDFAAKQTTSFSKATNVLTQEAARLANKLVVSNSELRNMGDSLRRFGKDEGVLATEFAGLNTQITNSVNKFKNLQSAIERGATGPKFGADIRAYIDGVQALNGQFNNLEDTLKTVYKLDPVNSKTVQHLREMRTAVEENERSLQEITSLMKAKDQGGTFFEKLKRGAQNLIAPLQRSKKEIDNTKDGAFALSGSFDEPVKKAGLLGATLTGAAKQATVFGEAMKGAIIGSFLGPIFAQALAAVGKLFSILLTPITLPFQALLAPFKILSNIFDTIIGQVQQFFASLPTEFTKANNLVQNFNVTLTQMLSGFSKEKIEKALRGANEFIRKVIAKTPFELATGQAAFQQLITAGFDPKKWLLPAADAAAALNKDMHQLIFGMQRLKSGSKGMGVDMLRDFGIPVQQVGVWLDQASGKMIEANKVLGKSQDELKAAGYQWKQWKFDAAGSLEQTPVEALDILNGYLQQNAIFAGASAARSRTLTGVLSNLNDAVTTLITAFGQPIFKAITDILIDIYDIVNEITTAVEPFAILIGTELAKSIQNLWENVTGISQGVDQLGERMIQASMRIKEVAAAIIQFIKPALMVILALVKGDFPKAWGLFLKAAQDVLKKIGDWLKGSGKEWLKWGVGLVKQIAQGLISGARTFIKGAVTVIGNMIGSFLKPGSDPETGPLSTISKWGAGLAETFASGFKLADMSFLTNITDSIKSALGSLGIDQFKAIRQNIIQIIGGINQTGTINEELWQQISNQIGAGNAELSQFVRLTLELKKVTKEYQDAEKAGFIPKELQDRLDAAQLAVQLKEEELKLQEQIKQSSGDTAGSAAGGGGGETAIDLKKQLADELEMLKKRKKVGLISEKEYQEGIAQLRRQYAEQYLVQGDEGAAKDQVKLAQETDKKIFEQDREFLEKKKKLGLLTEQEYLTQLQDLNKQEAEKLLLAGDEGAAKEKMKEAQSLQKAIDKAALAEQKKALEKQIEQERAILKIKYDKGLITEQEYKEGLVRIQEGYIDQLLQMGYPVDKEIDKLKSLKEELKKLTEIKIDQPQDILAGFGDEVTGELQKMMDDVMKEFGTLGTSTWEEFTKTFHDAFDGIWEEISASIFGGEGGGLGNIRENLLAWAGTLWSDLTAEGGPLSNMTDFFNRISEGFITWASPEGPGSASFQKVGILVGESLVIGIKAALGLTGGENKIVNELANSIAGATASFFTAFNKLAGAAVGGFIQGLTGLGPQAAGVVGQGMMDSLNPWGNKIVQSFVSALTTGVMNTDWIFILSPVVKGFQWLYDFLVGDSLIPELVTEIVSIFTSLPERLAELDFIQNIKDMFPTFEDMQILGSQMMEGLKQGWEDIREGLHTKFDEIVPQWIRDRLPINSPAIAGPLSVPINWNYLSEGLPEAMGILKATLTQGITEVANTTQTTMFNMKNAITEGIASSADTVKRSMFDMKNEVTTTIKDIDETISKSRLSQDLGSGFGNYGHGEGSGGPNIAEQGGIAASWKRFFALLRGGTVVSPSSYQHGTANVPSTGKALIHKGEMILPAKMADIVRSQMLSSNTHVKNTSRSSSNVFQTGAFAGAFPNVTKGKDAVDIMKQIEAMVGKSEMRATVV